MNESNIRKKPTRGHRARRILSHVLNPLRAKDKDEKTNATETVLDILDDPENKTSTLIEQAVPLGRKTSPQAYALLFAASPVHLAEAHLLSRINVNKPRQDALARGEYVPIKFEEAITSFDKNIRKHYNIPDNKIQTLTETFRDRLGKEQDDLYNNRRNAMTIAKSGTREIC